VTHDPDKLTKREYNAWMTYMDHATGPEDGPPVTAAQRKKLGCARCKKSRGPSELCPEGSRLWRKIPKRAREMLMKQIDVVTKIASLSS
jgi:hypothetical protein